MDFLLTPEMLKYQAYAFQIMMVMGLAKPCLEMVVSWTKTKTDDLWLHRAFDLLDLVSRVIPRAKMGK